MVKSLRASNKKTHAAKLAAAAKDKKKKTARKAIRTEAKKAAEAGEKQAGKKQPKGAKTGEDSSKRADSADDAKRPPGGASTKKRKRGRKKHSNDSERTTEPRRDLVTRHTRTESVATGEGAEASMAAGRQAKAPALWDMKALVPKWAPLPANTQLLPPESAVALELRTARALARLRARLEKLCSEHGLQRPVRALTFERWRFAAKWEEQQQASRKHKNKPQTNASLGVAGLTVLVRQLAAVACMPCTHVQLLRRMPVL